MSLFSWNEQSSSGLHFEPNGTGGGHDYIGLQRTPFVLTDAEKNVGSNPNRLFVGKVALEIVKRLHPESPQFALAVEAWKQVIEAQFDYEKQLKLTEALPEGKKHSEYAQNQLLLVTLQANLRQIRMLFSLECLRSPQLSVLVQTIEAAVDEVITTLVSPEDRPLLNKTDLQRSMAHIFLDKAKESKPKK